ncbi:MAG TPA: copper chaperone PCu(A)C [Gammaproteobacteria bacterium]|nr:copper chaperone PCu(A)C [Gammaproteobacteria bacterium]
MPYLRAFLLLLFSASAGASDSGNLAFREAYIAAAPPGATAMAAYMTIENPGDGVRRITSITSPDFKEVQMHRSTLKKGVAHMQQLDQLVIEAGSMVELKPGGTHLMLLEPVRDFEPGEVILLEIKEADGTEHNLGLKVQRAPAASTHHHQE